jgi:hypothetical protein
MTILSIQEDVGCSCASFYQLKFNTGIADQENLNQYLIDTRIPVSDRHIIENRCMTLRPPRWRYTPLDVFENPHRHEGEYRFVHTKAWKKVLQRGAKVKVHFRLLHDETDDRIMGDVRGIELLEPSVDVTEEMRETVADSNDRIAEEKLQMRLHRACCYE